MTTLTIPTGWTPYPWQIEAARRVASQAGIACCAAPGAGKTAAALLAAQACGAQRILVVAPAGAVARQWVAVARQWGADAWLCGGPGEGGQKLADAAVGVLALGDVSVAVVPWSRLSRTADADALVAAMYFEAKNSRPIDLLIVDEAHYAQGAESVQCGKALLGAWMRPGDELSDLEKACGKTSTGWRKTPHLLECSSRSLGLTGTPVTSAGEKIRCQLLLARDEEPTLRSKSKYLTRWWGYRPGAHGWITNSRPAAGHEEIVRRSILRVSDADLRAQLPAHRRELVKDLAQGPLPEGPQAAALAAWAGEASEDLDEGTLPALAELAEVRRAGTVARAVGIAELCASWHGEAEAGRMLIVWCLYHDSAVALLTAIREALDADTALGLLHGGLSDKTRQDTLAQARAGQIRVLVATIDSTGTGVDGLQAVCDRQLVCECPWNPGKLEQAEGRIVRTGQKNPVLTTIVAAGVEGVIAQRLCEKSGNIEAVLASATVARAATDTEIVEKAFGWAAGIPAAQEARRQQVVAPVTALALREADPIPACPTEGTWTQDKRSGEWAASLQLDCGADNAKAWIGTEITLVTKAGKKTRVVLVVRLAGKQDGTWSMWRFKEVITEPTIEEKSERAKGQVEVRIARRATGPVVEQDRALTAEESLQAFACVAAAKLLTDCDSDWAKAENGIGWAKPDCYVGRIAAGILPEHYTLRTLRSAKLLLQKYKNSQIPSDLVSAIGF